MNAAQLTIRHAQINQPWTVPYSAGVNHASQRDVPHILATHDVLHAAKTVGKLAAVFEELDHSGQPPSAPQIATIAAMAADLFTEALRLANLYGFDLATVLVERVREKNAVDILTEG